MRIREMTLAILLILSLAANVFLLTIVFNPGEDPGRAFSQPPVSEVHPSSLPTGKEAGSGGTASMQAPVILQKIEVGQEGPFALGRVTEEGAMVDISVEVVPGRGRILVQTTPLMGVIFQDAANQAVVVARNHSHVNLSASDIIFSIQGPEEISEIDGPSAGALMAMLLLSVVEGFDIDENVTVTGTIDEDGMIGPVGGVIMKAEAAAANGKTLLLLSGENNRVSDYREETRTFGGLRVIRQRPITVDTKEYIEENYGIQVEYVSSIDDLLKRIRLPAETPATAVARLVQKPPCGVVWGCTDGMKAACLMQET